MRDYVRPLLSDTQHLLEESQRVVAPPSDDEEEENWVWNELSVMFDSLLKFFFFFSYFDFKNSLLMNKAKCRLEVTCDKFISETCVNSKHATV